MSPDGGGTTSVSTLGPVIDVLFPADFRWVRRHIQMAIDTFRADGMSAEDAGSVEIVLAEALNNVVEHGYGDAAPGQIRLVIRMRPAALMVEIRDRGRTMPQGRAPLGDHPMGKPHAHDATPEGGFGWLLIRELVRDLVYDRQDGENILLFRLKLGT